MARQAPEGRGLTVAATRVRLGTFPTPLHRLDRLSDLLGADIWIKRDDLTGFGMGGNKVRKVEYLFAEAQAAGADVVITAGAVQSNHARVAAAGARRLGIECHLVLSGKRPERPEGNVLLDTLSEARLRFVTSPADRAPTMDSIADEMRQRGRKPYVIPIGGSNATGARGYVAGMQELVGQIGTLPPRHTRVVYTTSSGGTAAGLLVGRAVTGSEMDLLGVRVDRGADHDGEVCSIANELATRLCIDQRWWPEGLELNRDFIGPGYAVPTPEGIAAIQTVWREEGILLDPVYTGKAMAALMVLARQGAFAGERVVFLHTGGEASVFAAGDVVLG